MKVLSAKQMGEADKVTMKNQNISSEQLMERAAELVFKVIDNRLQGAPIPIKIFCGIGNNGGDGLVIARHLIQHGYHVTVYVVNYSDNRSDDFLKNYDKLKDITNDWPKLIKDEDHFPEIGVGEFVIDAMFGVGLNRPIEGWPAKLIQHINDSKAFTLAVDMPSGLFTDRVKIEGNAIIEADFTLTFQNPKLVFFLPETMDFIGDFEILDIGLDRQYLSELQPEAILIGKNEAAGLYNPRKKNTHKGNFGHLLVAGGSYGKIGSVLLSAKAALRTGCGLCTFYIPKCGYEIAQTNIPEAMVITDPGEEFLEEFKPDIEFDVIAFGMGAGKSERTSQVLKTILQKYKKPMLIDADGINLLSENSEILEMLIPGTILTPHPGELKRLVGEWKDDFEKLELVKNFSSKNDVIMVIKGAYTFTVYHENIYINNSGNPGMATAGSGDVLSGVISSLLCQEYEPDIAAVLGVYLHGLSGNITASKLGLEGVMAGDMANNMGLSFQKLFEQPKPDNSKAKN